MNDVLILMLQILVIVSLILPIREVGDMVDGLIRRVTRKEDQE